MKIEFQKHFCGFRLEAHRSENTELHNTHDNGNTRDFLVG